MINIIWKKGFFSSSYELFQNNINIGKFRRSSFSSISKGKINDAKLEFKKKGLFSSNTDIIDLSSNKNIGEIQFNAWGNKVNIILNNEKYTWKYNNFWGSKWSISNSEKKLIIYKSATTSGNVKSISSNDLLLLSGFYVIDYLRKLVTVISISTSITLLSS